MHRLPEDLDISMPRPTEERRNRRRKSLPEVQHGKKPVVDSRRPWSGSDYVLSRPGQLESSGHLIRDTASDRGPLMTPNPTIDTPTFDTSEQCSSRDERQSDLHGGSQEYSPEYSPDFGGPIEDKQLYFESKLFCRNHGRMLETHIWQTTLASRHASRDSLFSQDSNSTWIYAPGCCREVTKLAYLNAWLTE